MYADIKISEDNLEQLPVNCIPKELTMMAQLSNDMQLLAVEHSGYVPRDEGDLCACSAFMVLILLQSLSAKDQTFLQEVGNDFT